MENSENLEKKKGLKSIIDEKMDSWQVRLFHEFVKRFKKAIKEKDKEYFQFIRACNKAGHSQRTDFIKSVFGETSLENIVVEEEFNPNKQCFGANFLKEVWTPAKKMNVSLSVLDNQVIREYSLPESMNGITIQNKTASFPLREKRFWGLLAVLTESPKLGQILFKYELQKEKVYFLHMKRTSKKIFIVRVVFQNGKWGYHSRNFLFLDPWGDRGDIFLNITSKSSKD
jgi:hypothetical protein